MVVCFFFEQKTADEMLISDWSSDVCSSDLHAEIPLALRVERRDGGLHATSERLLDHLQRLAPQLLATLERERSQRVDHLALLVHHVVVLEESLARDRKSVV